MHAAHDVRALSRQWREWAPAEVDGVGGIGRSFRGKARVVQKLDEAAGGVCLAGRRGHVRGQLPPPVLACPDRAVHGLWLPGELVGEDPGQLAIGARVGIPMFRHRGVAETRTSATGRTGGAPRDEACVHEQIELLAHRVGVEADGTGDLPHPDGTVRLVEDGKDPRARKAGEDAVAEERRYHGLHFARL